jgi:hypothetical protein
VGRDHGKYAEALDKTGIGLVRVTETDLSALDQLRKDEDLARAASATTGEAYRPRIFAEVREGDLAVVTKWGDVLQLNQQHMTGLEGRFPKPGSLGASLVPFGTGTAAPLASITEQRAAYDMAAEFRAAYWQAIHDARALDRENATTRRLAIFETGQAIAEQREVVTSIQEAKQGVIAAADTTVETGIGVASKMLGGLSSAVEGVWEPGSSGCPAKAKKYSRTSRRIIGNALKSSGWLIRIRISKARPVRRERGLPVLVPEVAGVWKSFLRCCLWR